MSALPADVRAAALALAVDLDACCALEGEARGRLVATEPVHAALVSLALRRGALARGAERLAALVLGQEPPPCPLDLGDLAEACTAGVASTRWAYLLRLWAGVEVDRG